MLPRGSPNLVTEKRFRRSLRPILFYFSRNKPTGSVYIMGSEAMEKEMKLFGFKSIGTGKDDSLYTLDTGDNYSYK